MKINQIKAGSLLSYVQMGMSLAVGLLYTPAMIRLLGTSEYGLYNTVASTISMLSVLSLGFNSSYIRYYSVYKKDNNQKAIQSLNGMFLIIFSVIGAVALLCGGFLSFNLDLVFDKGLTSSEYVIARILMLLLTVNLTATFPMSVFSSIISAHEKYVFLKILGIFKTVGGPLVTLPLLLAGYGSIAMVAVTVSVSLIIDTCYLIFVLKVLKQKFVFKNFEKGLFKSLFIYTSFIAINLIVDQINTNMGKVILGRYLGTTAVAIYSAGYTLYVYYRMFSSSVSTVFTPRIHRIVANAESTAQMRTQLTDLFIKVGRIQFLILALVETGIIFFGPEFMIKWAGAEFGDSYYVAVALTLSGSIALIQNLGIEIQRAENNHKFRSIAYAIMAVINIFLTAFLCQRYGAVGGAFGTVISYIVANGFIMNIYYHKKCNVDIIKFWKSIIRLSLGLIIPIACGVAIRYFMNLSSVVVMLCGIVIYTVVYSASMWFFGMNEYERNLVSKPMKKIFRKIKH